MDSDGGYLVAVDSDGGYLSMNDMPGTISTGESRIINNQKVSIIESNIYSWSFTCLGILPGLVKYCDLIIVSWKPDVG